jgi:glycosyltransferase involved in cell wall biosynthesis
MKILLVADRPNWAYDILAKSIKKHSKYSNIDIDYVSEMRLDLGKYDFANYDVVFFFLWYDAMRHGIKIPGFNFKKTCVGIHSLSSWKNRKLNETTASQICNQFAASGYISEEIGSLLSLENGFLTPNGIDSDIFYPSPLNLQDEIRFMWVGNPGSSHHGLNKGYYSIIEPVFSEYKDKNVKLCLATPENPVQRDQIGNFYRDNHVLICSSLHEGGPLPVIESLACGRPVITTNVGVIPEVIVDGKNGLIFPRSRSGLRDCINKILANPNLLEELSENTVQSVSNRKSTNMVEAYEEMFEFVYSLNGGD